MGLFDASTSDEICDNGIDDDEDGLIDLNDEDCYCTLIEPVSLIRNPSFEEQDCCPGAEEANFDCATFWIQASAAHAHYFHDCDFSNALIPVPIPDGGGVIGLLNGKPNEISNYKEYLGACLRRPMRANVPYKFQFEIGFSYIQTPISIEVSLFGTADCENLPFGGDDQLIGCPTNTPNWVYLGKVHANPIPGWTKLEIDFTPSADIAAIALGPPCIINDLTDDTDTAYYFFDNLILDKAFNFNFEIQANDQLCSPGLSFEVPPFALATYQWYKDGIALTNETEAMLENLPGSGFYQVRIDEGGECQLSKGFDFTLPSILVDGSLNKTLFAKIFPFETYNIGDFSFAEAGNYTFNIEPEQGCDTLVNLTLDYYSVFIPNAFSPNDDGINDTFTVYGGADLQMILTLQVFDRWGGMVYNQQNLMPNEASTAWNGTLNGKKLPGGAYIYVTTLLMDDNKAHRLSGGVTLSR